VVCLQQEVQKLAKVIAKKYRDAAGNEDKAWENAANNLRQPYWGWDDPDTFLPPDEVISDTTVRILGAPRGEEISVPNPFLAYTFPSENRAPYPNGSNPWPATARHGNNQGQSDVDDLKRVGL
jgi:hypothetical protein